MRSIDLQARTAPSTAHGGSFGFHVDVQVEHLRQRRVIADRMTDSDDPIEGRVVGMSCAAEEAPIAILTTDEEHGLLAVENLDADIRLQVRWNAANGERVGHDNIVPSSNRTA